MLRFFTYDAKQGSSKGYRGQGCANKNRLKHHGLRAERFYALLGPEGCRSLRVLYVVERVLKAGLQKHISAIALKCVTVNLTSRNILQVKRLLYASVRIVCSPVCAST